MLDVAALDFRRKSCAVHWTSNPSCTVEKCLHGLLVDDKRCMCVRERGREGVISKVT
ncbi:hypothetical protein LguiB_015359 [Lonicera macranthoides]